MTDTTPRRHRPYYEGLENGDRLAHPIWGMPGPAIETTFQGVRYVLDCDAQHHAVNLMNRRRYRHDVGRRSHAQATLWLAARIGVNTYLASLIAEWVSPNHCGIGWQTGRVRILSREEEHAWRTEKLERRHKAEITAAGGVCTVFSHRNNRACPTPKARLDLTTLVQQRFGSHADLLGYRREENATITLRDVRDRADRLLWDSTDGDADPWPALGDAVMLLGQCLYACTDVGDGLTLPLAPAA